MSLELEYIGLANKLKDFSKKLKELPQVYDHDFEKLLAVYEEFFKRHPLKPGSLVVLKSTPEITEKINFGWLGSKHWMKTGAKGQVIGLDYNTFNKKVQVTVEFFNQTFIDEKGLERPVSKPYVYFINEEDLILI